MKIVILVLAFSFFASFAMASSYDGNEVANWLPIGTTDGLTPDGQPCQLFVEQFMLAQLTTEARILFPNDPYWKKAAGFNTLTGGYLESRSADANQLKLVIKIIANDSYSSDVRETIQIQKMGTATRVYIIEKELRIFGRTKTATCTI